MEELENLKTDLELLPHRDKNRLEDLIFKTSLFIKRFLASDTAFLEELNKIKIGFIPHTPAISQESDFEAAWSIGKNILSNFYNKLSRAFKISQQFPQAPKHELENGSITTLIERTSISVTLPDGINHKKYSDIFENLKTPLLLFQFIFIVENILRLFLIKVLNSININSIISLGITNLTKKISSRKREEANNNYLPVRGSHDIYYLDLKDLKKIIVNRWDLFRDKFPSQNWITQRIDDLYKIRVRVAHNSGNLTPVELQSVETYSREIINQIDPYI